MFIKNRAFGYIIELIKKVNENLSLGLDTYILLALRNRLKECDLYDAWSRLDANSPYKKSGNFKLEEVMKNLVEQDSQSDSLQKEMDALEREVLELQAGLSAADTLSMMELDLPPP